MSVKVVVSERVLGGSVVRFKDGRAAKASPDVDLIRGCRGGEVDAWQRVLDRYERLVFSVPRRYGLSREDAADITQLTFTILVQSIDTLKEDSNLGAWLAVVARRHTWRLLKRNRREDGEVGGNLGDAADIDGDIERWELTHWLDNGLALMGGRCQDLLHALYLDEDQPSYAEVAERLGIPANSVGPTRIRCLRRLRKVLGE